MARLDMNREILARERLDADRRYNDALTTLDEDIVDAGRRAGLERADFERIAERLIVFLQQITAFVESKDRELAADVADRVATIAKALDAIAELRTQVNVLQRATGSAPPAAPGTALGTSAPGTSAPGRAQGTAPGTSTQHPAPSTQHPAELL